MNRLVSLLAPLALLGCAVDAPTDEPSPTQAEDAVPAASKTDAARPCGDQTLAVVDDASGVQIAFCQLAPDVVSVGELIPAGTSSRLAKLGYDDVSLACAGAVYRALAPGKSVPAALDRCSAEQRAVVPTRAASLATPVHSLTGGYCGTDGASNFSSWVSSLLNLTHDAYWNQWQLQSGTISHSMNGMIDDEGNYGRGRMAACGGNVRFLAQWRWDVGDTWISSADVTVGNGGAYDWYISHTGGLEDIDIRFVEQSQGGSFRNGGIFADY